MTLARWSVSCVVALIAATPIHAQDADVLRRSFAFFDRSLTVEVIAESDGVLRVLRGARTRVDVAARAEPGIAALSLGGWHRDRLRLTALGADRIEYIVTVPEHVSLHIILPDQPTPVLAETDPAAIYRWTANADPAEKDASSSGSDPAGSVPARSGDASPETNRTAGAGAGLGSGANHVSEAGERRPVSGVMGRGAPREGAPETFITAGVGVGEETAGANRARGSSSWHLDSRADAWDAHERSSTSASFETYSHANAPSEIVLPSLASIRRIGVRIGGDRFRIETSRPLALSPGRRDLLKILARGEPLDLVIHVPASTRSFTLRTGADIAASVQNGILLAPCQPATRQILPDGRQWVDYSPEAGRLDCKTAAGAQLANSIRG